MSHRHAFAPLLALFVVAAGCKGASSRNDGAAQPARGAIDGKSISVVTKGEIGDALRKLGQSGYYAKLGCPTYLEDEALVAVCVEGRPADARALLDKLVWH